MEILSEKGGWLLDILYIKQMEQRMFLQKGNILMQTGEKISHHVDILLVRMFGYPVASGAASVGSFSGDGERSAETQLFAMHSPPIHQHSQSAHPNFQSVRIDPACDCYVRHQLLSCQPVV